MGRTRTTDRSRLPTRRKPHTSRKRPKHPHRSRWGARWASSRCLARVQGWLEHCPHIPSEAEEERYVGAKPKALRLPAATSLWHRGQWLLLQTRARSAHQMKRPHRALTRVVLPIAGHSQTSHWLSRGPPAHISHPEKS